MKLHASAFLGSLLATLAAAGATWIVEPTPAALGFAAAAPREFRINLFEASAQPGDQRSLPARQAARRFPPQATAGALLAGLSAVLAPGGHAFTLLPTFGGRLAAGGHRVPNRGWTYFAGDYAAARHLRLTAGRPPTAAELAAGQPVGLLGAALAARLFPHSGAVGQSVAAESGFTLCRSDSPRGRCLPQPPPAVRIVGVFAPSPAHDENLDPDEAVLIPAEAMRRLEAFDPGVPAIMVGLDPGADAAALRTTADAWARRALPDLYVGLDSVNDPAAVRSAIARTGERRSVGLALAGGIAFSAMLGAAALALLGVARSRHLVGLDRALGATRLQALRAQAAGAALAALAGGAAALALLAVAAPALGRAWSVPAGPGTLTLAAGSAAAALMAAAGGLPLARVCWLLPATLLARSRPGRGERIAVLTLTAAAVALGGGAAGVAGLAGRSARLAAEVTAARFDAVTEVSVGRSLIDPRLDSNLTDSGANLPLPVFTPAHAASLARLPGVRTAVLVESLAARPVTANGRAVAEHRGLLAGPDYLAASGTTLTVGGWGGCLLSERAAATLRVGVGSRVNLPGVRAPVPCRVSGLYVLSDLDRWLAPGLPEVVVPADLKPREVATATFRPRVDARHAHRILVYARPDRVAVARAAVARWLAGRAFPIPGRPGTVVRADPLQPFAPQAAALLAGFRAEAQALSALGALALCLALAALALTVVALVTASRWRLALDRALGATRARLFLAGTRDAELAALGGALGGTLLALASRPPVLRLLAAGVPGLPGGALDPLLDPMAATSVALAVAGVAGLTAGLAVFAATRPEPRDLLAE